jgi:hypothetical protein
MLFRTKDLSAIVAGERTLAFRRWKRPAAAAGRTVKTQMGLVGIDAVEPIDPASVTGAEAMAAGYPDLAALRAMFDAQQGTCYRIRLHYAGPDTRPAPGDNADIPPPERERIGKQLARLDAGAPGGPWTAATLRAIAEHPSVVSTRLAELLGRERFALKDDIRKLKALGLTESLKVGYRLSPRGETWLRGS